MSGGEGHASERQLAAWQVSMAITAKAESTSCNILPRLLGSMILSDA